MKLKCLNCSPWVNKLSHVPAVWLGLHLPPAPTTPADLNDRLTPPFSGSSDQPTANSQVLHQIEKAGVMY